MDKDKRRAQILYTDDHSTPFECDCCDGRDEPCAHIQLGITDFVWVVCRKCLREFLYALYSEKEIRKLKLQELDKNK